MDGKILLQYYPSICILRLSNFTKVDLINETKWKVFPKINFIIINIPNMDNSSDKFLHIPPCYIIIQPRFKC